MAAIDDILAFAWPENCNAQGGAMLQFLGYLNALSTEWENLLHPVLQLNQDASPTTADWESLWETEGNVLPIPDGARLLWFRPTDIAFGGLYTVANSEIVRVENAFYPGKTDLIPWGINTTPGGIVFSSPNTLYDLQNPLTIVVDRNARLMFRVIYHTGRLSAAFDMWYRFIYRLGGVTQIVDGGDDTLASWITTVARGGFDMFVEVSWLHPTLLTPGSYAFTFFGSRPSDANGGSPVVSWGNMCPPQLDGAGFPTTMYNRLVPPTIEWELIYQ
ncbi:hypothetical protein Rctr85_102 [Virus Rctr85]|nr:hypothetical protein Rctr85_102 [Virus Rctr85]